MGRHGRSAQGDLARKPLRSRLRGSPPAGLDRLSERGGRAVGRREPDRLEEPHRRVAAGPLVERRGARRSEEHTSELQSPCNLVCRLLLEKKKKIKPYRDEEKH